MLLCNGNCKTSCGTRRVVFDSQLNLRPVAYGIMSGYRDRRATYQVVEPGDVVMETTWDRSEREHSREFYVFNGEGIDGSPLEKSVWKPLLRDVPEWVHEFLAPHQGRRSSYIPVPQEKWLCVVSKRKFAQMVRDLGVEVSIDLFDRSKKSDLQVKRLSDLNLDQYLTCERHWGGSVVDISQYEDWYGVNGGVAVKLKLKSKYESGSNYAHSQTFTSPGKPGIPKGYKMYVCIQYGLYMSTHGGTHYSYGVGCTVYK